MRLYLFEDAYRDRFEPFALTRPVGEILFGCDTLRARIVRVLGGTQVEYAGLDRLAGFTEPGAPILMAGATFEAPCCLISSRFVPDGAIGDPGHTAALVTSDGRLVGWHLSDPSDLPEAWEQIGTIYEGDRPSHPVGGRLLDSIWQLLAQNPAQLTRDLSPDPTGGSESGSSDLGDSYSQSGSATVYGEHPVQVADGVVVGPHVVLDARGGPIRIEAGVTIEPATVVGGPCFIGAGSTLLGGRVRGSSIGPQCKIHGEVSSSIVLGFSNKAHDGYLGHAVLGRWVNLGAMTTNSDLKNNYSQVRVDQGAGPVDTGDTKVGAFLGDHVKTGIGTLLGTGTVIGAGSNVMAGPVPPRHVPPFSWGSGAGLSPYGVDRFITTARIVMERREQQLDDGMEALLRRAWNAAQGASS